MKIQYLFVLAALSLLFPLTAQNTSSAQTGNNKVYTLSEVDTKPVFSQGKMTSRGFLDMYRKYPPEAIDKKLEGVVILSLIIKEDGEVDNPSILQGADPILNKEAMRIASLLPYYTPGYVNNKPVSTKILFPVSFSLPSTKAPNNQAIDSLNTTTAMSPSTAPNPLYIIDGKKVDTNVNLDAAMIESIRVVKGTKALVLYGPLAQDGVIIINTKVKSSSNQ